MLYANTDDGSSAQWVCDENGIVVDNISIYGAERVPILEQINEHYGTSFTGWSDNEIGLRFGDPIPNWNAYEKIELQITKWAAYYEPGKLILGYFDNDTLNVQCVTSKENSWVVNEDGVYIENIALSNYIENTLKYAINQMFGVAFNEITYIPTTGIDVGSNCPNWNEYSKFELPEL